jgi:hypothetical protein
MGHGEHHPAAGYRVTLALPGPAPLAPPFCPVLADEAGPELPVCRVAAFIFGADWHNLPIKSPPRSTAPPPLPQRAGCKGRVRATVEGLELTLLPLLNLSFYLAA